ncbi:MAG: hypothetical protein FWD28_05535 [Treponema sp.]|nr:hypothetical protein [Treponema sp.]
MKKKITSVLLFIVSILIPALAFSFEPLYGKPAKMQITFINQTGNNVKVYLNNQDEYTIINQNETFESDALSMDFENTYPLYIAVERNDDIKRYYAFERPEFNNIWEYHYYVIINPDEYINRMYGINIFSKEFYLTELSLPDSQRTGYRSITRDWRFFDPVNQNSRCNLEIIIINSTGKMQKVTYRDHEREIIFELASGEARLITIFNPIFLQKNSFEGEEYLYYNIEPENYYIPSPFSMGVIRMEKGIQIRRMREGLGGVILFGYL